MKIAAGAFLWRCRAASREVAMASRRWGPMPLYIIHAHRRYSTRWRNTVTSHQRRGRRRYIRAKRHTIVALPRAASERHGLRAGDLRVDPPELHPRRCGRVPQHAAALLLAVLVVPRVGPVPRRRPQNPSFVLSRATARPPAESPWRKGGGVPRIMKNGHGRPDFS